MAFYLLTIFLDFFVPANIYVTSWLPCFYKFATVFFIIHDAGGDIGALVQMGYVDAGAHLREAPREHNPAKHVGNIQCAVGWKTFKSDGKTIPCRIGE